MPARVSFVMGKGGVGRTTVASALAYSSAADGRRVLLVSPKGPQELASRIKREIPPGAAHERLDVLQVAERELVDDAIRRITRLGPMTEVVFRHPAYESFIDIVPGIRELALLNLVHERRERAEEAYDHIVVDAPATGHGLHFLEAPDKASKLLVGKLRERTDALNRMLRDPASAEVVLVVIPQEIPVRETRELAVKLREQGFPVGSLVVNRWMPRVFAEPGSSALLDRLAADAEARARLAKGLAARSKIDAEQAVDAFRLLRAERREAEARLAELRELSLPLALVPFLLAPEGRIAGVADALRRPLAQEATPP